MNVFFSISKFSEVAVVLTCIVFAFIVVVLIFFPDVNLIQVGKIKIERYKKKNNSQKRCLKN